MKETEEHASWEAGDDSLLNEDTQLDHHCAALSNLSYVDRGFLLSSTDMERGNGTAAAGGRFSVPLKILLTLLVFIVLYQLLDK